MVSKKKQPWYNEWGWSLILALVVAGIFRSFAFQPFSIPSGSMIPNLLVGDYLFVSKYSYGFGQPSFPFGLIPMEGRFGSDHRPERGDVVVFQGEIRKDMDYIKRVVGLPGDRIQMINGVLYINYKPVQLEKIQDFIDEEGRAVPQYLEKLPGGVVHTFIKYKKFGRARFDNTPVVVVPEGHYFMMGDNRDMSSDSRDAPHIGLIPEKNLIGKAQLIFFSIRDGGIWQIWRWLTDLRLSRFFQKIR